MSSSVRDLPAPSYPLTIEIWAAGVDRRGEPSFRSVCTGPGAVWIPGLGEGAWTRVSYADGDVLVVPPRGAAAADF